MGLGGFPTVKTVRLSFMLWALERQVGFDPSVEMVAAAGYQGIELTGQFQHWTPAERDRVMKTMMTHGMVFDSMSGCEGWVCGGGGDGDVLPAVCGASAICEGATVSAGDPAFRGSAWGMRRHSSGWRSRI